jgi:hypothetical protein
MTIPEGGLFVFSQTPVPPGHCVDSPKRRGLDGLKNIHAAITGYQP